MTLVLYAAGRRRRSAASLQKADDAAASCRRPSTRRCAGMRASSRLRGELVPFYEYDEQRFFGSDGAPADVAAAAPRRLQAAGRHLRRALRQDAPADRARSRTASPTCSSPAPTACRSSTAATCAAPEAPARSCARRRASRVTDLDGNSAPRPDRLVRRQRVRLRLLQGVHRRAARARARAGPGAGRLPPGRRRQRPAPAGRSRASTRCRSTCRAPRP